MTKLTEDQKLTHMHNNLFEIVPTEIVNIYRKVRNPSTGKIESKLFKEGRIKLLTAKEKQECLREAQILTEKIGENQKNFNNIYLDLQGLCLVRKAFVTKDMLTRSDGTLYYTEVYLDVEALGNELTPADVAILVNAYTIMEDIYSPFETLDSEEIGLWVEKLADKGLGVSFLSELHPSSLPTLILLLAEKLSSLCQENGLSLLSSQPYLELDRETSMYGTISVFGQHKNVSPNDIEDKVRKSAEEEMEMFMAIEDGKNEITKVVEKLLMKSNEDSEGGIIEQTPSEPKDIDPK